MTFNFRFNRGRNAAKGIGRSGSGVLSETELAQRVEAEVALSPGEHGEPAPSRLVTTLMWLEYGDALLEREREVRELAARSSWSFHAFDLGTTKTLKRSRVTTFTPSTCRNVSKAQHQQVPFILADLTRARYDLENPDKANRVDLLSATMCVVPFAAPQTHRLDRASAPEIAVLVSLRRYRVTGAIQPRT